MKITIYERTFETAYISNHNLNFAITQANTDNREPLKNEGFLKAEFGKLFANKGYIFDKLTKNTLFRRYNLIKNIRKNMKNSLMAMDDKIILRKRSVIETVNYELKNICQIEHLGYHSFTNLSII